MIGAHFYLAPGHLRAKLIHGLSTTMPKRTSTRALRLAWNTFSCSGSTQSRSFTGLQAWDQLLHGRGGDQGARSTAFGTRSCISFFLVGLSVYYQGMERGPEAPASVWDKYCCVKRSDDY